MNTWTAIGRLTDKPEVRFAGNGTAVAELRIAVNYDRDTVDFFTVTTFGRSAENAAQYLVKGQRVAITGHLKHHRWDSDGETRSRVEIVADRVEYLDTPRPRDELLHSESAPAA